MSSHYAIVADLANTRNDNAYLDVASDDAAAVKYVIGAREFVVPLNANRFATSPDVFSLGVSLPTLVFATTVTNTSPPTEIEVASRAALRQKKIVITAPRAMAVQGVVFRIPFGDAGSGAQLLIANPLSGPSVATVDVFAPPNNPVQQGIRIEVGQVKAIALPGSAAMTSVCVSSTNSVPVIVQLAVSGRGQEFTQTYAEPIV